MKARQMCYSFEEGYEIRNKPREHDYAPSDNAYDPRIKSIFYNIQRQVRKYPQEKDCEVISDREAASRVKFGVQKEAMDLIRRALLLYNQVEEDFSKMKFDKKGNLVENHPYRIRKFTGRKQNDGYETEN